MKNSQGENNNKKKILASSELKKKESGKINWELKTLCNMRVIGGWLLIIVDAFTTVPKGLKEKTGGIGDQRKNRNHLHYNIIKIGYNTQ